jgi:hypothetical protein
LFFGEFDIEGNIDTTAEYSMPDSVKEDIIKQLTHAVRRIIKKQ